MGLGAYGVGAYGVGVYGVGTFSADRSFVRGRLGR